MPETKPHVRLCTMPNAAGDGTCGQAMTGRLVEPAAVAVVVYRCLVCDTRRCKCGHIEPDPANIGRCKGCGRRLHLQADVA